MNKLDTPHQMQVAQLKISPGMGPIDTPKEEPAPEAPTPAAPPAGTSSGPVVVTPKMGGTVAGPPPSSEPAPEAAPSPVSGGGSNLNITITNPENLPALAPGDTELKLVIRKDEPAAAVAPPEDGIGFVEVFLALVAALVVAPYVQKEAGKWVANLNAINFVRKNGMVISIYLLAFTFGWMLFMIVLPQVYMLDFSFRFNLTPDRVGGPEDVYTLKNYKYLILGRVGGDELLNWLHLNVFFKTIMASVIVTVLDFLLCYPLAYYMAQSVKGGNQRLLFLCLILPFWVNEILRAFAFKLIFAQAGILNTFLTAIGVFDTPFDFFKADVALYSGLMYAYLLLMIFPLYSAIESLDHNQVEAARDMGASWLRIHLRVVMPHAKPGIASGCTMVFMLSAGALAAPNILGGPSSLWFTQIIYQWYNTGGNWPQGSAYAFVLLIACIIFVRIMMRIFKVSLGEIAGR